MPLCDIVYEKVSKFKTRDYIGCLDSIISAIFKIEFNQI